MAGRATVLIFPDLNTGNNTYKAVQRSANAVAIGPVLQGLNKPVNDLSRGALVADIVNTVAITAIQAQGGDRGRCGVMTNSVLVINSGLVVDEVPAGRPGDGQAVATGLIERIGGDGRRPPTRPRGETVELRRARSPTTARR